MAQFIALCARDTARFSDQDFAPILEPEAERARALYGAGVFRAVWGRGDLPGAVILVEAETLEAAQAAVGSLPLVEKGMLQVTLIPLAPYRGFLPRG
ncbi:MAG TPA: hypothetical protein VMA36_09375 [Candidatus Limnocylindria bacterium]|jgi:hypothetical protein|nr:hypothetical protein [Candidatus Limnocylindria bacterium]